MFTHIVLFKLKEATKENIEKARDILASMEGKIPELKYLEVGVDIERSERSFDVSIITRFDSEKDYRTYAISDYHVNYVLKNLKPMLECSKSMDY